jgi:hypothetical protein
LSGFQNAGAVDRRATQPEREFRKDGYSWKVRHTFGAAFLDHRGLVKMVVT